MNACNLMLLAAGLGTRLRPLTDTVPKPALPLFHIPLGYYLFPYLQHITFDRKVVNTFHLPEQIHSLYNKISTDFVFSDEKDFIKDSGGGLQQAERYFNKDLPIITCNADEVFFAEDHLFLQKALDFHQSENNLATLIVMRHPEAGKKFGAVLTDDAHRVKLISKKHENKNLHPWHYIGVQILSPHILKKIPSNKPSHIFYDVLVPVLDQSVVKIFPIECDWYEVGSVPDYCASKKSIENELQNNNPVYHSYFSELKKFPRSHLNDLS